MRINISHKTWPTSVSKKPHLCNSKHSMNCKNTFSFKKIEKNILRFVREPDHGRYANYVITTDHLRKQSRKGSSYSGIRASQQGE